MSPDQTPAKVTPAAPREGQDRKLKPPPPPDHHVKCPRCDSPSTKFCYYNNYSLSQPRHFCKTCRRYWTKGGALRNVPIGGGCRKNKRTKQRLAGISNSRDSSSCEIMGSTGAAAGLNFFQGFLTPAMDFQLGSVNPPSSSSMFPLSGNFSSYDPCQVNSGHHPSSRAVGTLMGFDYLRSGVGGDALAGTHQMGPSSNTANTSMIVHSNLASSIESLSSINQELHWKLQQQRLAVFFSENQDDQKRTTQAEIAPVDRQFDDQQQQIQTQNFLLQPILFQNLETRKEADPYSTGESRIDDSGRKSRLGNASGLNNNSSTEWFFDVSPYANDGSNNSGGLDNNEGNNATVDDDNQNNNWNTGIQAWSDMQQYNGLP